MTSHRYSYPNVVPLPRPATTSASAMKSAAKRDAQARDRTDRERDPARP